MKSINHAQIRAFHAVAASGSFTRAAASLHVTQPTLSAQVKALEETYGVALFDRRGRGVQPTELGRRLLDITRRYFGVENEAEELLAATRALSQGHLRLGADAPHHAMTALAAFNRKYPKIKLTLAIGNAQEVLAGLLDHRSDVAYIADAADDVRLHATKLRADRLVAVTPKDHAWAAIGTVPAAVLARERLLMREAGSTTRHVLESAMARAGLPIERILEINSREGVREAVATGLGVGVIAMSEFGSDPRLAPIEIAGVDTTMTEYVVCLVERRDLRIVRAFLDIARGFAQPG